MLAVFSRRSGRNFDKNSRVLLWASDAASNVAFALTTPMQMSTGQPILLLPLLLFFSPNTHLFIATVDWLDNVDDDDDDVSFLSVCLPPGRRAAAFCSNSATVNDCCHLCLGFEWSGGDRWRQ